MANRPPPFFVKGLLLAFVAATEDGYLPTLLVKASGKFFHHWSFSRSSNREIADNNYQTPEGSIAKDPVAVEKPAKAYNTFEEVGKPI